MPHVYSAHECVCVLSSPSQTRASSLQSVAPGAPRVCRLGGLLEIHSCVLLGQRALLMPFLPQTFKGILCLPFSDLPLYDSEIGHRACRAWEGGLCNSFHTCLDSGSSICWWGMEAGVSCVFTELWWLQANPFSLCLFSLHKTAYFSLQMRVSGAQRCLFLFHMHAICGPWCLRLPDRPTCLSVSVQSGRGHSPCLSLLVQRCPEHRGISGVDGALESLITFRKVANVVQRVPLRPPPTYPSCLLLHYHICHH